MFEDNNGAFTEEEVEFFREALNGMIREIDEGSGETIQSMQKGDSGFPDPADRANYEFERNRTLRLRDRQRKLIGKINKSLQRLEDGEYNECEECGDTIGKLRLKARPVTTLCVSCKEVQEQEERSRKI